jgi:opacity protein-like surface antigen
MTLLSACPIISKCIGAAALMAVALPALAGDLSNGAAGGIKDYGSGGIPVPAPMPYEETFKWYLRGDIGTAFKSSGNVDVGAWPITVSQPNNWSEQSIIGVGFGRYITPSLRTEFMVDYRTDRKLASGSQALPTTSKTIAVAGTTATNLYSGMQAEEIGYQNTTLMMSGYYDFNQGGRFRPYVGAGVGLAIHQLRRNGADFYNCFDGAITVINTAPTPNSVTPGCSTTNGLQTSYAAQSNAHGIGYGLAGQLTGGLSYDITPRTHWDTGYQLMWQSGRVGVSSLDGVSALHIKDRFDHIIRTGVRWDVW